MSTAAYKAYVSKLKYDKPKQTVNAVAGTAEKLALVIALLKSWGFNATTRGNYGGKQARKDIQFAPVAVIQHSTAGDKTSLEMLFDNGNGVVPGPLCNFAVTREGEVILGAAGYANHAGLGNKAAGQAIIKGLSTTRQQVPGSDQKFSMNRYAIGIESRAAGFWTAEEYDAGVGLLAAIVLAFEFDLGAPPIGGHKEFTRRKVDPKENMAKLRSDVVKFIANWLAEIQKPDVEPPVPVDPPPVVVPPVIVPDPVEPVPDPAPEDPTPDPEPAPLIPKKPKGKRPTLKNGSKGAWAKYYQECLIAVFPPEAKGIVSSGGADGEFGDGTEKATKLVQEKLNVTADGIVGDKTWAKLEKFGIGI